jgi:hypothetical protein
VKWNGAAKDPRHVEFETDQADIGFTGKLIQLRPNWHKFLQQRGIDGVVQHEQVLPFSGEKRALLSDCHSIIKTGEEVLELQTIIGSSSLDMKVFEVGCADPAKLCPVCKPMTDKLWSFGTWNS